MKLDPKNDYGDYYWVADPLGGDGNDTCRMLIERRFELDIIGGIEDKDADYSYDNWALCKLDDKYYLLSTSGCSCPSPRETWRLEIGPATLEAIEEHVKSGKYHGYTLPKKQEDDFIALIKRAKEDKHD